VDQTVDGDVQQDTHTERDVDATIRVPMVHHQHTSGAGSKAQEPLPAEAASHQVVVGEIPLEPPGFRSRADLLAKLDPTEARVLVIYPATGLRASALRNWRPHTRGRSWRTTGGWWPGSTLRRPVACRRDWLRWLRPQD
jgi:hypothetical protein